MLTRKNMTRNTNYVVIDLPVLSRIFIIWYITSCFVSEAITNTILGGKSITHASRYYNGYVMKYVGNFHYYIVFIAD